MPILINHHKKICFIINNFNINHTFPIIEKGKVTVKCATSPFLVSVTPNCLFYSKCYTLIVILSLLSYFNRFSTSQTNLKVLSVEEMLSFSKGV